MRLATIILGVLALATPARAEDTPTLVPTHDVAITYRVSGDRAQDIREIRAAFDAHGGRLRLSSPQLDFYLLVDLPRRGLVVVMPPQHLRLSIPGAGELITLWLTAARLHPTQAGTNRIAGRDCTIWQARAQGRPGSACLTAGGVLLGGTAEQVTIRAISVTDAPQPDALFNPPEGLNSIELPPELGLALLGRKPAAD